MAKIELQTMINNQESSPQSLISHCTVANFPPKNPHEYLMLVGGTVVAAQHDCPSSERRFRPDPPILPPHSLILSTKGFSLTPAILKTGRMVQKHLVVTVGVHWWPNITSPPNAHPLRGACSSSERRFSRPDAPIWPPIPPPINIAPKPHALMQPSTKQHNEMQKFQMEHLTNVTLVHKVDRCLARYSPRA